MNVEDYLELNFHMEERLRNFLPGLMGPVPKGTREERLLFQKKHLRQQFPILMKIQPGMRYDSNENLITDLNEMELKLYQDVKLTQARRKPKKRRMNKATKVEDDVFWPNLPAVCRKQKDGKKLVEDVFATKSVDCSDDEAPSTSAAQQQQLQLFKRKRFNVFYTDSDDSNLDLDTPIITTVEDVDMKRKLQNQREKLGRNINRDIIKGKFLDVGAPTALDSSGDEVEIVYEELSSFQQIMKENEKDRKEALEVRFNLLDKLRAEESETEEDQFLDRAATAIEKECNMQKALSITSSMEPEPGTSSGMSSGLSTSPSALEPQPGPSSAMNKPKAKSPALSSSSSSSSSFADWVSQRSSVPKNRFGVYSDDDDRIDAWLIEASIQERKIDQLLNKMNQPNCPASVFLEYFQHVDYPEGDAIYEEYEVPFIKVDAGNGGVTTDPTYQARRLMPLRDWQNELPKPIARVYSLPTEQQIRLQAKMFGKDKAPFMQIGNKMYFLEFVENIPHIIIYQNGGYMKGGCISYTPEEFQLHLHGSSKALDSSSRMLLRRILDIKLKAIRCIRTELKKAIAYARQHCQQYAVEEKQHELCQLAMIAYQAQLKIISELQAKLYKEYTDRLQIVDFNDGIISICETHTDVGTFCMRL